MRSSTALLAPAAVSGATSAWRRWFMYSMISGQHLCNCEYACKWVSCKRSSRCGCASLWCRVCANLHFCLWVFSPTLCGIRRSDLIRLSLPFFVTFVVAERSLDARAQSILLNSFTPGYICTQIPAAGVTRRAGAKNVLLGNNLAMVLLLAALPAAMSSSAVWPAAACLAALGVVQGPYQTSTAQMTQSWVPKGPERPLALYAIRLGSQLSKLLAAVGTPFLCGRFGWRNTLKIYIGALIGYASLWAVFAASQPAIATKAPAVEVGSAVMVPSRHHFDRRMLVLAPSLCALATQVAANVYEFHLYGGWAPAYFNDVLGVPLPQVGRYLRWPMLVSIFAKPLVAMGESAALRVGVAQLWLRKVRAQSFRLIGLCITCFYREIYGIVMIAHCQAAIVSSSVIAASGLLIFMHTRSLPVATVAVSWVRISRRSNISNRHFTSTEFHEEITAHVDGNR